MKTFWVSGWNRENYILEDKAIITVFVSKTDPRSMSAFEAVAVEDLKPIVQPLNRSRRKDIVIAVMGGIITGLLFLLLMSCSAAPKDEVKIENETLRLRCEIQCFPEDVRWNFVKHECICLKD